MHLLLGLGRQPLSRTLCLQWETLAGNRYLHHWKDDLGNSGDRQYAVRHEGRGRPPDVVDHCYPMWPQILKWPETSGWAVSSFEAVGVFYLFLPSGLSCHGVKSQYRAISQGVLR